MSKRKDRERREILEGVAAGEIEPEEAARRLEALEASRAAAPPEPSAPPPPPEPPEPPQPPQPPEVAVAAAVAGPSAPPAGEGGRARRVRVDVSIGSARIVGDPEVAEAEVSGPHQIRREGDTLVVECEPILAELSEEQAAEGVFVFARGGGPWVRRFGLRRPRHSKTLIRVNRDLPLDVDVSAGSIVVHDVHGPIRCDVDAGSAKISGFRGPIEADVDAGALHASGVLAAGHSRIRCDAGSLRLTLEPGSDVRVRTDVGLGRLEVRAPEPPVEREGRREFTVGKGTATLDVEGELASIRIDAGDLVEAE